MEKCPLLKDLEVDKKEVNFFRFKKIGNRYLITNDFGFFHFLGEEEFCNFVEGELDKDGGLYDELREKGFVKDVNHLNDLMDEHTSLNSTIYSGPDLHIVVVTYRCNQDCVYCQASSKGMEREDLDMDKETARKVVDMMFQTTSDAVSIEFQGGEPLVNWPIVKYIIEYAQEKEEELDKEVNFSLVTNFSLMTDERLKYLIDNQVSIATSLDGPEKLHNANRPMKGGGSYQITKKWIEKYQGLQEKAHEKGNALYKLNALVTVSRESLDYPKEIIDEYLDFGFQGLHLRPLSYLGYSGGEEARKKIGYSAEEFLEFWRQAMDYILKINLEKDEDFFERGMWIMAKKVLGHEDPGFLDLRSPCGAVIGQVLYDYNGDLYTCDEGRMVEDDTFKLGNVEDTTYEEMVTCDTCKTMVNASTLENQACDLCAYSPYCGVCPVKNYALEDTLFPQMENTDWCKVKKAQFDYLFSKLRVNKYRNIFERWAQKEGA